MNNYQAAAAQAGFPPASPHAAGGHGGPQGRSFPAANSPGPIDMYSSSAAAAAAAAAADSAVASYVQAAASPQPPTTAFPAIAVSRAPLNYSPVSPFYDPPSHRHWSSKLVDRYEWYESSVDYGYLFGGWIWGWPWVPDSIL